MAIDKLAQYAKAVAGLPGVSVKGDTVPYTSVNGHMFSYLSKSGTLCLRLPTESRDAFLKTFKTKLSIQYGIVQKEYVEVPDALLAKASGLKKYFALSYAYVSGLKPKPTKTKQPAKTRR